jgi:hypothetical protein
MKTRRSLNSALRCSTSGSREHRQVVAPIQMESLAQSEWSAEPWDATPRRALLEEALSMPVCANKLDASVCRRQGTIPWKAADDEFGLSDSDDGFSDGDDSEFSV